MRQKIIVFLVVLFLVSSFVVAENSFLKEIIYEGESKVYSLGTYEYNVTLLSVFDSRFKAQFELNGEKTNIMGDDDTYRFSDGSSIFIRSILPQEAGEGDDLVQFNFFPARVGDGPEEVVEENVTEEPVEVEEEIPVPELYEEEPEPVEEVVDEEPKGLWRRFVGWFKGLFG